jgi:transposase-like protein
LSTVETAEEAAGESSQQPQARAARPGGSRRRKLAPEQEHEIAQLYADGSTPTSEIRERFGIGESSLYRIVQRHGVPLRGRGAASTESRPARAQAPDGRRRASAGTRRASAPVPRAGRGPSRRGARRGTPGPDARPAIPRDGGVRQRFRVVFQGQTVVEARDVRDAVRQAALLGATEVTAVTPEE